MQKEVRNIMSALSAICLGVLLVACTQVWYLSISKDASHNTVLCFSQRANCRGEGAHLSHVTFYEVNGQGDGIRKVWDLDPKIGIENNTTIKEIVLGVVPKNWTESHAYGGLESGKFYSINGEYFFRKRESGEYEILQRSDFYKEYVLKK